MRPVLLEMSGFGSFRAATTVDFRDVDYFALVGPTGAGKSTVIDAMVFALYGSVPRWDDRRTVAPALAPTVNRGTVRLVFDVGPAGARYVVARELRRGARGGVSTANARLERLVERDGVGSPDEATLPLAADSEVSERVAEVVGLSFDHFCRSVVLPQGDFAEFLHATPSDRQGMLSQILGYQVYEEIGRRAGSSVKELTWQAERLDAQIAEHAAAGGGDDGALARAEAAVAAMATLQRDVAALLPRLAAARDAVELADARAQQLGDQAALLRSLEPPPGSADLTRRVVAARAALAGADDRVRQAERSDAAARAGLADAPARSPLEQARRDHDDLIRLTGERRGLSARLADAIAAAGVSRRRAEDARGAARRARAAQAAAAAESAAAAGELAEVTARRDLLAQVRPPHDPALPAQRARAADAIVERSRGDLAAAAAVAAEAVTARDQAAGERPGLLAALAAAAELERVRAELVTAAAVQQQADRDADDSARELGAADDDLRRAETADAAAALRVGLRTGDHCPVCEQVVVTVPVVDDVAGPGEARERAARARRRHDQALAARHAGAAQVQALTAREATLLATLPPGRPATRADLATALAVLDATDAAAGAATARVEQLRAALATHESAARAEVQARDRALRDLVAVAASLTSLGAPQPVGDDLAGGWAALTAWAQDRLVAADQRLAEVAARTRDAAAAAARTADEVVIADADEAAAQAGAAAADAAHGSAQGARAAHEDRIAELTARLAAAPAADDVARELARLDVLTAVAEEAAAAVTRARAAHRVAGEASSAVEDDVRAARAALNTARDRVVGLGAPAVREEDPAADWQDLLAWAGAEASRQDTARAGATVDGDRAREALAGQVTRLSERTVAAGLDPLPPGAAQLPDPGAGVAADVAAALTRREAELGATRRHRDQIAGWVAQREAARRDADVAREVHRLMRSDAFPSWLVGSALDVLVDEASRTLLELSGGQYSLASTDRALLVVDHADADARRPVRTLSGGETFQASLALALALSSQLPTLAAPGAAVTALESILLDEGFGTLDESTLEVVAATLESLAAGGGRLVGVVTHVAALAERVPVRFRVSRDGGGSAVVREAV